MDDELEQKFEKIIQEAIEKAEAVDCTFSEFVSGLEVMKSLLGERLGNARGEEHD